MLIYLLCMVPCSVVYLSLNISFNLMFLTKPNSSVKDLPKHELEFPKKAYQLEKKAAIYKSHLTVLMYYMCVTYAYVFHLVRIFLLRVALTIFLMFIINAFFYLVFHFHPIF